MDRLVIGRVRVTGRVGGRPARLGPVRVRG